MGETTLVLIRHGETEWSRDGRHTGRTDLPLTPAGERGARALAPALATRSFGLVLSSPLQRARRTARLAGLDAEVEPLLVEWDYGEYEGRTTAQIDAQRPGWTIWTGTPPGGESIELVSDRADRVLARLRPALERADVALVAHGHILRVLVARVLGFEAVAGSRLVIQTSTLSEVGTEHDARALTRLNWSPTSANDVS